jgi:hypothetical protein
VFDADDLDATATEVRRTWGRAVAAMAVLVAGCVAMGGGPGALAAALTLLAVFWACWALGAR